MNIKRFQIWETDWLYDNPAYIPGQYDDMKECSDDGSNVICKYDPNTCKCSAAFYVSKGLTFSEYWCKIWVEKMWVSARNYKTYNNDTYHDNHYYYSFNNIINHINEYHH